ncbi:MAG: mucoidy inhibitor MuiA family protein [bacterium]
MTALLVALMLGAGSTVDSVVVYPNQVLVVRTARVTVAGPGRLEFDGLPGALDDNTVRVRAQGMRLGEVQVARGYQAEPTPAVRRLKELVERLERELKGLANEADVLKAKEEFLNSVKLGAPELISKELQQGRVSTEAWRGALSFLGGELGAVKARQLALEPERKELEEKLKAAREEYNAARAANENRKELRFDYSADAGSYDVRISYVIPGTASWAPWYELRARPDRGAVELAYFAKLSQRTGEDWERVKVVLSTTQPVFGQTAPEPRPWYLSLAEALGYRAAKAMPAPGVMALERQITDEEFAGDFAAPVETGISLQYVIPGRVSLRSGEPAKKLALTQASLPAAFSYYTLPRARDQAFLKGEMVNATGFVFLAGEAGTYVGDEFTGSTWLGAVAAQESTEVSFGVDERVKVSRELVRSFKSKGGLFSNTEKARLAFRLKVENFHPRAATIEVLEQVPVSRQKEVRVKVLRVEPAPLEQDEDTGVYRWRPRLESGAKFEAEVEFEVEYPAGRRVQGLF